MGGCNTSRFLYLPTRIIRVYIEALKHSVTYVYTVQIVPTAHCFLKAAGLKRAPTVAMVGRLYIPRTGEGAKSLQLLRCSTQVNQQLYPLNDLLQELQIQ